MHRTVAFCVTVTVAAVMLAGCVAPQRPARFVAAPRQDVFDVIARSLVAEGHEVATVDAQAGIVYTRWQDTGWNTIAPGFGGGEGTVVRRYAIVVARAGEQLSILLRADTENCRRGDFTIVGGTEVRGSCARLEQMFPPHQRALDELGERLRAALATN